MSLGKVKAASIAGSRFAFSGFDFNLRAVAHVLVFNPVGAVGLVVVIVGAGVGWFGLAWLAAASTIRWALL